MKPGVPAPRANGARLPALDRTDGVRTGARAPAAHLGAIVQALSMRYNNLVCEMKSRGEDVIVLSLGEAFFDIPLCRRHDTGPMWGVCRSKPVTGG